MQSRPQEVLSAGQFFAVMRLVLHAQAGREPAKALVFVQRMSSIYSPAFNLALYMVLPY